MYTKYTNLPDASRVWIYQSDREFTAPESEYISQKAIEFIEQWTRHGDDLKGSFIIKYNQFLVLAVDAQFNSVSGCSIDASVRFIQQLQNELQLDLMHKMNVTFKDNNNINLVNLSTFQQFAKEGKITKNTVVFNNMVATKHDLETKWEVTASESWHNRFIK